MSYENFPIAVVDNGGQWTHREYRVLNYLGCRAEIISNVTPIEELDRFQALVLSGGAPRIESESEALGLISEYLGLEKWPILGICVGHQYMATHFQGQAGPATRSAQSGQCTGDTRAEPKAQAEAAKLSRQQQTRKLLNK